MRTPGSSPLSIGRPSSSRIGATIASSMASFARSRQASVCPGRQASAAGLKPQASGFSTMPSRTPSPASHAALLARSYSAQSASVSAPAGSWRCSSENHIIRTEISGM